MKSKRELQMEKNIKEWSKKKQTCYNCGEKIPNPEFFDHIKRDCPNLTNPYIDVDGLRKVFGQ